MDPKRSGSDGAESNEFMGRDEAEKGSTAGMMDTDYLSQPMPQYIR